MELHVLYNRSGKILAAVPLEEDSSDRTRNGNRGLPALRPEPGPGQYTANVKVPDDCAHLSFFEVCTQLVVEGARRASNAWATKGKSTARCEVQEGKAPVLDRPEYARTGWRNSATPCWVFEPRLTPYLGISGPGAF